MSEALAQKVSELVQILESLRDENPEKFFNTPYEALHRNLKLALESYERERFSDPLQEPEETS